MRELAPIVVIAIGNPSRGDDAIGPFLAGQLETWLEAEGLSAEVEVFEDFQLQIEHALDLKGRRAAVFIDAGDHTPAPFTFGPIQPGAVMTHTSHALPPEAVLQVYQQIEGRPPPPAWVLCVRGEQFALGEPLTVSAEGYAVTALTHLQSWLKETLAAC